MFNLIINAINHLADRILGNPTSSHMRLCWHNCEICPWSEDDALCDEAIECAPYPECGPCSGHITDECELQQCATWWENQADYDRDPCLTARCDESCGPMCPYSTQLTDLGSSTRAPKAITVEDAYDLDATERNNDNTYDHIRELETDFDQAVDNYHDGKITKGRCDTVMNVTSAEIDMLKAPVPKRGVCTRCGDASLVAEVLTIHGYWDLRCSDNDGCLARQPEREPHDDDEIPF